MRTVSRRKNKQLNGGVCTTSSSDQQQDSPQLSINNKGVICSTKIINQRRKDYFCITFCSN